MSTRFPFAFARSYRLPALVLSITPSRAWVEVTDEELYVRYGLWSLRTPRTNLASAELTGGFTFLKTAGPPHLSMADRGISFTTNGDRALCVQFHEPVRGIDPTGRIKHPGATLSVADPQGLAKALGLEV